MLYAPSGSIRHRRIYIGELPGFDILTVHSNSDSQIGLWGIPRCLFLQRSSELGVKLTNAEGGNTLGFTSILPTRS